MKLKHNLEKQKIESIDFIQESMNGESGWIVYLRKGFSFDPLSDDSSRFIPASNPEEINDAIIFSIE